MNWNWISFSLRVDRQMQKHEFNYKEGGDDSKIAHGNLYYLVSYHNDKDQQG